MTQDQNLTCRDCGKSFIWTGGEQDFFSAKGFPAPVRCPDCRKKRRDEKKTTGPSATGSISSSENHAITCQKCGRVAQVPFKPRNPEGVLCSECFTENNKIKK